MKPIRAAVILSTCLWCNLNWAQAAFDRQRIEILEQQLKSLINEFDAQQMEDPHQQSKVDFGGYGEMHYNQLDADGSDLRELNFRRFVLFIGYDFNERARLVSEFEIENTIVSPANRGAVELEQAYLEFDLAENKTFKSGIILMPVGIINETHEPDTFYGVNRPIIETTIIPTTWWAGGVALNHRFESGFSYDLMLSEGLKTEDPSAAISADPFDIKAGKQKTSFAAAHDFALTTRAKYSGIPGLELAAYLQYQPDLDQSAKESYADSALLSGGHAIYQLGQFIATGLYARWDLAGDKAKSAGKELQSGAYVELSYRPVDQWGTFMRLNQWSQIDGENKQQIDIGVNYWPIENVVFKFDIQNQNQNAGDINGFNLGMGYHF